MRVITTILITNPALCRCLENGNIPWNWLKSIAKKKNLELTHPETFNQSEANRYQIYRDILKTLPWNRNIEKLEERLKQQGITNSYKCKWQTLNQICLN